MKVVLGVLAMIFLFAGLVCVFIGVSRKNWTFAGWVMVLWFVAWVFIMLAFTKSSHAGRRSSGR
jgi:hypothetical protein